MIELKKYMDVLNKHEYVIVKYKNINLIEKGNDIDIFCFDSKSIYEDLVKQAMLCGDSEKYIIKIEDSIEGRSYVDFYEKDEMVFRFDLYDRIPKYKKVNLKSAFFSTVIENREKTYPYNDEFYIYTASKADEMIVRYAEFLEYYAVRPDKIKHLQYITDRIDEMDSPNLFIERLHYYTEFPYINEEDIHSVSYTKLIRKKLSKIKKKIMGT